MNWNLETTDVLTAILGVLVVLGGWRLPSWAMRWAEEAAEAVPVSSGLFQRLLAQSMEGPPELRNVVALVSLDNLPQLEQQFGAPRTAALVNRLGKRLHALVFDTDIVGRVDSSLMGLILEGPVSTVEARDFGARVLGELPLPADGLPAGLVARVRIAMLPVPGPAGSAEEVIATLRKMLRDPLHAGRDLISPA